MPTLSSADLIKAVLDLRKRVKAIKESHRAELAPYEDLEQRLEVELLRRLNAEGGNHIGTPVGTAYRAVQTRVSVSDWTPLLAFVQEQGAWHFLVKRVSPEAVESYLEEHRELPPGINISRTTVVNVRATNGAATRDTDNER